MTLENNGLALKLYLETFLPLQIAKYRERGGITDTDIERTRDFAVELASHGDTLLFGGKSGEAGAIAGRLLDALAVLSFCPGESQNGGNLDQVGWMLENWDDPDRRRRSP